MASMEVVEVDGAGGSASASQAEANLLRVIQILLVRRMRHVNQVPGTWNEFCVVSNIFVCDTWHVCRSLNSAKPAS